MGDIIQDGLQGQEGAMVAYKRDIAILVDPLRITLPITQKFYKTAGVFEYQRSGSRMESLPPELFIAVLYSLEYYNVLCLLKTSMDFFRKYSREGRKLPPLF
jgi:hypothetical protein